MKKKRVQIYVAILGYINVVDKRREKVLKHADFIIAKQTSGVKNK
jgi:hypothetical protein